MMQARAPLYYERGVGRVWLWITPVATAAMILSKQVLAGGVGDWWLWLIIGAVVQLFVWLQVQGGQTHVSVELTSETLRCGDEELPVTKIARILPGVAPDGRRKSTQERPDWLDARSLGRLGTVPRRRYGIGLELVDGSIVQAWAKDDYALRAALKPLVSEG